jgi:hypothetical protein
VLCETAPVFHHHHHVETLENRIDGLMAAVFLRDDVERMAQLSPHLAQNFVFVTPSAVFDAAEGLGEAFAHYRHDDWLGTSLRRTSPVETHHGYYRFSWQRVERGAVAMEGWAFGQVDEAGLIGRLVTFDGMVPGPAR